MRKRTHNKPQLIWLSWRAQLSQGGSLWEQAEWISHLLVIQEQWGVIAQDWRAEQMLDAHTHVHSISPPCPSCTSTPSDLHLCLRILDAKALLPLPRLLRLNVRVVNSKALSALASPLALKFGGRLMERARGGVPLGSLAMLRTASAAPVPDGRRQCTCRRVHVHACHVAFHACLQRELRLHMPWTSCGHER